MPHKLPLLGGGTTAVHQSTFLEEKYLPMYRLVACLLPLSVNQAPRLIGEQKTGGKGRRIPKPKRLYVMVRAISAFACYPIPFHPRCCKLAAAAALLRVWLSLLEIC